MKEDFNWDFLWSLRRTCEYSFAQYLDIKVIGLGDWVR